MLSISLADVEMMAISECLDRLDPQFFRIAIRLRRRGLFHQAMVALSVVQERLQLLQRDWAPALVDEIPETDLLRLPEPVLASV
jgi:hypothetical protein